MSSPVRLRLGTRASPLAQWQADWVGARLRELPGEEVEVELVHITTSGDQQQEPIGAGTAPGLFTKEIQRALLALRDPADHAVLAARCSSEHWLCRAHVVLFGSWADND